MADRASLYPPAPRVDLVDTLHGVRVADPYRRLESADDPATAAWVDAQNALTRRRLDTPLREQLAVRLRELHRVPRTSVPAVRGARIFFTETDGTRGQAVLYLTSGGERRALVDPNQLDAGATTAITVFEPDEGGDRVVYGLSRDGSDLQELMIYDVASAATLGDRLQWVKFASIAWWDGGFFYTRYPQPGTVPPEHEQYFCQVWFHRVGEAQTADRLVYHRPDAPEVTFDVAVTSDRRHLVVTSRRGASDDAEVHVLRLAAPFDEPRALVTGFSAGWHFIDGMDGLLYFRTDEGAPFGQVVRFDVNASAATAEVVVPESGDTLVDAAVSNGHLVVSWLRNASSRLTSHALEAAPEAGGREIALPGIGTIVGIGARWQDARAYITFTSFTTPPAIMACDAGAGTLAAMSRAALPIDPAAYVTEQVWYPSKDGTSVSMFLVSRRDGGGARAAGLDAGGSVLLSGYGGFNISLTPTFDASDFLWLDAGGVLAVANVRGGGEYGDAWHRAGMLERKQNVFDDFIAAAEWLIKNGRAAPGRLAIEGGSNGGLLVSACLVQRPDLYGAVVCRVPVADMLRYHRFTVGRFWIPEYGCADKAADFPYLLRYSPYHNVAEGAAYPPVLIMTADTDDRVAPGMAKKLAARLQDAADGAGGGPILLRVETRAGHGAGKPLAKQIDEHADIYAFLFTHLTQRSASEQLNGDAP